MTSAWYRPETAETVDVSRVTFARDAPAESGGRS